MSLPTSMMIILLTITKKINSTDHGLEHVALPPTSTMDHQTMWYLIRTMALVILVMTNSLQQYEMILEVFLTYTIQLESCYSFIEHHP